MDKLFFVKRTENGTVRMDSETRAFGTKIKTGSNSRIVGNHHQTKLCQSPTVLPRANVRIIKHAPLSTNAVEKTEWKNLTGVWEHVTGGDKAKFVEYVQKELRDLIAKDRPINYCRYQEDRHSCLSSLDRQECLSSRHLLIRRCQAVG
jgi:hypothetical protein